MDHVRLPPLAGLCALAALLCAAPVRAQEACSATSQIGLERQLRQLSLDLLGRPPTIAEYRAAQAKGRITAEDVREMMTREDFYTRMRGYHRALFKSNVSASVYNNNDARVQGTGDPGSPFGTRGTPTFAMRGGRGVSCDPNIAQATCNAFREDPHAEPATKTCFDANGVPLPVSYDYDTNYYACTRLDVTDATITSCDAAVTKGALPDKHLYFCDLRRDTANALHPWLCLPDPARSTTIVLTQEILEPGTGRVVSFANPVPNPTASFNQLDRCTLTLALNRAVAGSYVAQRGCVQREGYVMTPPPFWDTTGRTQVATCAIEAQQRATNPATGESCETARLLGDRSCGCGAGFARCESSDGRVHQARIAAINTELELITDSVVRREEPYFNILTTRRSFVNGPLSALYRQRQSPSVFVSLTPPASLDTLPAVDFTQQDTWVEYTRGPQHSGVLTTPAFLYRFPTYRARTNEFYEALLCTSFVPPANASFPAPEDPCNRENNLAKRCGCSYCHATLEPTGAHWGRFAERAATWLDPLVYPRVDPRCRDCALAGDTSCGGDCANYVMQAYDADGANSLGMLRTFLYRTSSEETNIEEGPSLLVSRMMVTGDLERCSVRRVWKEMLGRQMSFQEEELYLEPLVNDFAARNHNLKALIEEILSTDAYRRID